MRCMDFVIEQEQRLINSIHNILVAVAETVEVLEVACLCHFDVKFNATNLISLPRLKELTTHYSFALRQTIFEPCHQLRRMHIVQSRRSDLFGGIRDVAPSLTHLRFSGLPQEVDFGVMLEALGIREEPPRPTQGLPVAMLPSSMQKIIVKPSSPPARAEWGGAKAKLYWALMAQLHHLNEKEDRFVLLKGQDDAIHSNSDWLDRIVGKGGHWRFDDSDVIQRKGIIPKEDKW